MGRTACTELQCLYKGALYLYLSLTLLSSRYTAVYCEAGRGYFFFFMAQQPLVGQGLLITEASRSQSDTSQSIRLLWTSDRPDAETCTFTTQKTHKRQTPMTPAGFEPAIPASDRPQNHALERATTAIGGIVK